jgi:beta-lactamase regulating signal transducer with metallopeptidase domain
MGSIVESYDVTSRVILEALLNSFWPGLMVLLFAWFALRSINRVSATTRHAIWVVCLLAIGSLPFLPTPKASPFNLSSPVQLPFDLSASLFRSPSPVSPIIAPQGVVAADVPSAESGIVSRAIGSLFGGRIPAALVAIWFAVASILCARIAWSYFFLFRIRRRLGLVPAVFRDCGRELAEYFGIRRRVRIFTSPLVGAPMTMGWLNPLIVLPPDLLRTLSHEELRGILAHEMAHIKRWDYVTNLVQRLTQALLFFHPAVWVIGNQLSLERELACDDWAIKLTGEPRRYAKCLTRLVESMSDTRAFAAASGIIFGKHVISRRIEMILNRERNATTSVSKAALYSAVGTAAVAVVLATLISPAIAIPPGQALQVAKAQKAQPAETPSPASTVVAPDAIPPTLATALIAARDAKSPVRYVDAEAPLLPVGAEEPVFELLEKMPVTPAEAVYAPQIEVPLARSVAFRYGVDRAAALAPYLAQQSPTPAQPPSQAPRVRSVGFPEDRSSTPAIPEAELITVLSDVVKRDSDANVRAEALRGIYRFRSDAAITALLSLYDSIPDVKTKAEVLSYLYRSEGDNTKAVAKLMSIARTEKDETLRSRALSQLSKVKGDEGATNLIQIYDGLQDAKEKQLVIRYLGYNKSRKAADKLVQIAKNDADPAVRQSAIRSLYAIDNRLYLDMRERGIAPAINKVSEWRLEDFDKLKLAEEFAQHELKFFDREEINRQMQDARRHLEELQWELQVTPKVNITPEVKVAPRIK